MTLDSEISTPFSNNFARFCENRHFGTLGFFFFCSFTIKDTWKRDKVQKEKKMKTEQATLEEEIYESMVSLVTVKYKLFGL